MRARVFIGTAAAAMLFGVGLLAGSVIGTTEAGAQTPAATATPSAGNTVPKDPSMMPPGGMRGGRGMHGGMHRGFGPGGHFKEGPGREATAVEAAAHITDTTNLINLVRGDLTYATGKMDTASALRWVDGADALLKSAQSASGSSNFRQTIAYTHAARQLAMTARMQMAQQLGAENLPSHNQLGRRPGKLAPPAAGTATVTQAQASRVLAKTYNQLVMQGALLDNASNAGPAAGYLTDAQNAYRTAYDAYQAGNYGEAVASTHLAGHLAGVAEAVLRAQNATASADTPVTVPGSNFP